ncbi:SDR family oxidoreductase [Haloarcula nitratireducens]|uniref:SDR family oxidoreductase n=1 Tax=Haloarcula nitratireducens TaxID=2487749 RepID=A0AAW4P6X7_9EURY|nr:SDR family oxidoreductase [Halomicroarcula nitratireducens]MBX0293611.1 SDR family oxidoreductase [Halomicroarcula nitratireducens]
MGKTVLITGAASGIGRAAAEAFLDDDWIVWATAREEADVAALADDGCETAELDVTNARECTRVVEDVVAEEGRIDCLVNAARSAHFGAVEDVSTADFEAGLDVNLLGPHRMIRAVLPHMRARENGTIVNVSSVAGRLSMPGQGGFAASKFGLEGLSDALRVEASEFDVDVVLVEPGPVRRGTDSVVEDEENERDDPEHTGAYDWLYRAQEDSRLAGVQDALSVTPGAVALTIRDAANASDPEPRYPVGESAKYLLMARHLPARWRDAGLSLVRRLIE